MGEREALACISACERWHTYLYGRAFIIRTDHQALQTLFSSGGSGHRPLRLHRWLDRLYQYNFETEYRPGVDNTVADFLSRVPVTPVFEDSRFAKDVIQTIDRSLVVVTAEELKEQLENDSVLQKVRSYVVDGWPRRLKDEQLRGFFNDR